MVLSILPNINGYREAFPDVSRRMKGKRSLTNNRNANPLVNPLFEQVFKLDQYSWINSRLKHLQEQTQ